MASPTWISSITNSTLNRSLSTFSFQDALNPSGVSTPYDYSTKSPFLFQNGCLQPDGTQNCTASCLDETLIFGSLDTLHNCMVYPTVADLYASSNLSNPSLPAYYNIQKSPMGSKLYINITTTIQKCLLDYCDTLSGCTESLKKYDADYMMYSPSNITSSFYIYNHGQSDGYLSDYIFDICDYVPASFNPDIGGIGVYVSYWIQTGLAILSFLLVVWWNWGIYYTCLGALFLPRGYGKAKKAAQRIRNRSRNKHLPSLTGALAQFQKAQCFFMLAINIAALVNSNQGGFQPNNLQQLYNTYVLIHSISISGYLPVTFTLFTLHLVDVVTWYLLILSIVTVLVSLATLFVVGSFSPSQDDLNFLSQQALKGGPDSCGTKNLAVYCYKTIGGDYDYDSTDPASGAYSMLAFCLVVLLLLVAHQCHAFKDPSTGQAKPWLSKIPNAFFRTYNSGLRTIQVILALISIGLNCYIIDFDLHEFHFSDWSSATLGVVVFAVFTSCWTILFVLYLFLTSDTDFTRTDKPIGRYFNPEIVLAVDFLSAVFWFASFVAIGQIPRDHDLCTYDEYGVCGEVITSILIGVCLCITFVGTTALAARHVLRIRNDNLKKHPLGEHDWILRRFNKCRLQRWLHEMVPGWKYFTGKVSSWKQTPRKLPLWTKHPLIIDTYARLRQDTVPTMKSHIRRAYQDGKAHASTVDWPVTLTSLALFSLYLIFVGLYIHWFKIFIQDLKWFAYNGVDNSSWSFGQIVAITVWAEPLCEYFHLELRGMTRGFEHRLWGYKLVRITPPDMERGIVSDSTSSARPPSPSTSLDCQRIAEYGKLGIVESPVEASSARDGEHSDQEKGEYRQPGDGDPGKEPMLRSRDGSEEREERQSVGEWRIPETAILRGDSIAPF